jgi:hypothetical protein
MSQHIDAALRGWEYKPGMVQARLVQGNNGRPLLQLRVDLGILQLETSNRPDGVRPNACATYFEYLREQARSAGQTGSQFILSEEHCQEADREFVQYYHRRVCWLALKEYEKAIADADHTLAFMDFVRDHSPNEEYTQAHEQYRGFVLFQRTQAAALAAIENDKPEGAVDAILGGLEKMRTFFSAYELEEQFDDNGMVQQLRKLENSLRKRHGIEATLLEQLQEAVAKEEYETAARIRDALKKRQSTIGDSREAV